MAAGCAAGIGLARRGGNGQLAERDERQSALEGGARLRRLDDRERHIEPKEARADVAENPRIADEIEGRHIKLDPLAPNRERQVGANARRSPIVLRESEDRRPRRSCTR